MSEKKVEMKICFKCKLSKEEAEFSKNKTKADGLQGACRACGSEFGKNYRAKDGVRERGNAKNKKYREGNKTKLRSRHVERTYNITSKEHDRMLIDQAGKCKICKETMVKPNIDHCHITNRVRGLLCQPCNLGLGGFRDSLENLLSAASYLRNSLDKAVE